MTKKELIERLHNEGEFWASEKNTKKELEEVLNGLEKARNMTDEELFLMILNRN